MSLDEEITEPTTEKTYDRSHSEEISREIVDKHYSDRRTKRVAAGRLSTVLFLDPTESSPLETVRQVLKIGEKDRIKKETLALSRWRNSGAKVPEIIRESDINEPIKWFVMEYLQPVDHLSSDEMDNAARSFARNLNLLHKAKTSGYGEINDFGLGKYEDQMTDMLNTLDFFTSEPTILSNHDIDLDFASDLKDLIESSGSLINTNSSSVLLHGDVSTSNAVVQEGGEVVIIDPNPLAGDPLLDVGQMVVRMKLNDQYDRVGTLFLETYFGKPLGSLSETEIKKLNLFIKYQAGLEIFRRVLTQSEPQEIKEALDLYKQPPSF